MIPGKHDQLGIAKEHRDLNNFYYETDVDDLKAGTEMSNSRSNEEVGRVTSGITYLSFFSSSRRRAVSPRASPWVITDANLSPCKGKSFQVPGNSHAQVL